MRLHKVTKRFCPQTGTELDSILKPSLVLICDYSGVEIDQDNLSIRPQYVLKPEYDSGCEEVYYYDDIKPYFEEQLKIEYASLFRQPFVFSTHPNFSSDYSLTLIEEWMDGVDIEGHTFFKCSTVEEAMRRSRVRLVKYFIEDKIYTKEQLGLKDSNW